MATANLFPTEELSRKGSARYEALRSALEPTHIGEFVAIDVDSGDYAVANSTGDAMREMHHRRPEASLFLRRIGAEPEPGLAARLFATAPNAPERK